MMSQAGRDPVFRAAMAIANQDIKGVGEYCIRCHSTRGWLEGRSEPPDASALTPEDLHGVSCDTCHHFVDPLSNEAKQFAKQTPPGYGNAMIVADPANVARGPYGDGKGVMPHLVKKSEYHASSQLCATCHNVSNPTLATDVLTQPPYTYGHIERTYSEWALSDFAKKGREGTCQSCHYPVVKGGGQSARFWNVHRDYFVMHGPPGGSTWVQDAVRLIWRSLNTSQRRALEHGKQRARDLLKTAAALDISFPNARTARLRITNQTGHKLPTGYPEGRRMWVNASFVASDGTTIGEIGRYGEKEDTLFEKPATAPTLLDPRGTRVYESLPGMSPDRAAKFGKKPGKSFHFVLNDIIVKDNRIPPKGFTNAAFAEHLSQPVGAKYADGQHWDDFDVEIPPGTAKVVFRLMYQSVSWEYIKFLAEENTTDKWGQMLYYAWTKTGFCPPQVIIAEVSASVKK
jgi:hypothetical protein